MKAALLIALAVCSPGNAALSPSEKKMERPGLKNFHRVTAKLYRGAQPTAAGRRTLEAMGVKPVVNLRGFHSDARKAAGTKLALERVSFKTWHAEDEDVVRFLQIVTARKNQPVFVHCLHGSDRTGMMIAVYRIVVQGRSKAEAIKEMTGPDFGFHSILKNLVAYIEKLDAADLQRRANGLEQPQKGAKNAKG